MSIKFNPKPGALLRCDFTMYANPREPEWTKSRPVIVVARPSNGLCVVVALSTKPPVVVKPWHREMDCSHWPPNLQHRCWAKCDALVTVADWRLDRYYRKDQYGKRKYVGFSATPADLAAIIRGISTALGLPA